MSGTKELLRPGVGNFEPSPDAFERVLTRRDRKHRNRRIGGAIVGIVVATAGAGVIAHALSTEPPTPSNDVRTPFLGDWASTDADGSPQTMTVRTSGDTAVAIVVHDHFASVCSGVSSTMTGTGRLAGSDEIVIPSPAYACDDGSEPVAPGGSSLEDQLRDLTFVRDPGTDTITDTFGALWHRPGDGGNPGPDQAGILWPQSTQAEVREAQRLADAGDPRSTWQVDPNLETNPAEAELFDRYLREELGWTEFRWSGLGFKGSGYADDPDDDFNDPDHSYAVEFIRCAPGPADPNAPDHGCAPTIDKLRYEAVVLLAMQLDREGPSGIWVVTGRKNPVETVMAPPADAEATELIDAFLQARVDAGDAEQYLHSRGDGTMIPLLYATSTGAPYERYEVEQEQSSVWPLDPVEFKVRLFAEGGGTVVQQFFTMEREQNGRLALAYSNNPSDDTHGTEENDQPVAEPFSFLDGEVTFWAAPPWKGIDFFGPWRLYRDGHLGENVFALADPRPVEKRCLGGPAPADAEELARRIRSDPDLEATDPVAVVVGGTPALRMDVTAAPGASTCQTWEGAGVVADHAGEDTDPLVVGSGRRMRLYLLDLPDELSARVLAIAIVAPERRFERVRKLAEPIVHSIEFRTG